MSEPLRKASEVCQYIEDATKKTRFRGEVQIFLPKPDLDFVTCEETIQHIISEDNDLWLKPDEEKEFVQEVCKRGRKMFITCVYGDVPMKTLRALLNHGLCDDKLPFEVAQFPVQNDTRKLRTSFIPHQKQFMAAFFNLNSSQSLDKDMPKPIDFDEGNVLGSGAFGEVVEVEIPESQRNFSSGANKNNQFAMKITQHKNTREESFHQSMADLYHCHLVKCLSSFVYSSKYYMIYEKADCDVEDFMRKNPNPASLPHLTSEDFAQQLYGLADGLFFVHYQGRSEPARNDNLLGVPTEKPEKTGYFHDIKPENLLMFIYRDGKKKTYWIRLSDFSCAKVVELVASVSGQDRHSWLSMSKSGTPIYRAPEASKTGKTSRPYDIWSLGCVYLELLVWFLDGYGALLRFRESRKGLVCPNGREDEGFYFTRDTDQKSAHYDVRAAVKEKMDDISKRCKGPLKTIADVIPQLLKTIPDRRPTASQLVKSLKSIDSGARPPVEIGLSQTTTNKLPLAPPLPIYSSDSESDFGDLVKVQHPTSEGSTP